MKYPFFNRLALLLLPAAVFASPASAQTPADGESNNIQLVQRRFRDDASHRFDSRNRFHYRAPMFRYRYYDRPYFNRFGRPYDFFHRYDHRLMYPYRRSPYYPYHRYAPYRSRYYYNGRWY